MQGGQQKNNSEVLEKNRSCDIHKKPLRQPPHPGSCLRAEEPVLETFESDLKEIPSWEHWNMLEANLGYTNIQKMN